MFSIVSLAESSRLLNSIVALFIGLLRSTKSLIYASLLLFGLLAAVTTNDTVAFIDPPVAYTIAKYRSNFRKVAVIPDLWAISMFEDYLLESWLNLLSTSMQVVEK
ncbi:MAG: hypothetical protein QXX72_01280 [Desulfurococcaceae archaeon]